MYLMVAFACELFESSCELRMTSWYECVASRGPGSETELHPICNLVVSETWKAYQTDHNAQLLLLLCYTFDYNFVLARLDRMPISLA